jgi:hypothetical protein
MSTVTWSTAPIPAYKLAVGDRVVRNGLRLPVEFVHDPGAGRVFFGAAGRRYLIDGSDPIVVAVPDEPVDGYGLWRPKPHTFPSGCTCVSRRQDNGNWHVVARLDDCWGHDDLLDYDD